MYPETDIPPIQLTHDYVTEVSLHLPELPEQKLGRLTQEYGLNQKLARQILDSEYSLLFEAIVKESNVSPTTVAAFLTETAKALKRDGVSVEEVSENQVKEIFKAVGSGRLTKEAIPEVVSWLSQHPDCTLENAIDGMNLKMLSAAELDKIIDGVISNNRNLIEERGENAFGPLIGIVMKEVRGKANAAVVGELIKKRLERAPEK